MISRKTLFITSFLLAPSTSFAEQGCESWSQWGFWREASVKQVELCILNGKDPSEQFGEIGWKPIHWAVYSEENASELVKLLLAYGANPNATTEYGVTPSHSSATWGSLEVLSLLRDAGADLSSTDYTGETPFHHFTRNHYPSEEAVRFFNSDVAGIYGPDKCGWSPYDWVILKTGSKTELRELLEQLPPERLESRECAPSLHEIAADSIDGLGVTALVKAGIDPNAEQDRSAPPLHSALMSDASEASITALVEAGADVARASSLFGELPIHVAARYSTKASVIRRLISEGADVASREENWPKLTALHIAAKHGVSDEVLHLLSVNGASKGVTEMIDATGKTPADYLSENPNLRSLGKGAETLRRLSKKK